MIKPNNYNMKEFFTRSAIKSINVDYVQTGSESAETRVEVKLLSGDCRTFIGWGFRNYTTDKYDWKSIGTIRDIYREEVKKWKDFTGSHEEELKEYERLKKKFGEV